MPFNPQCGKETVREREKEMERGQPKTQTIATDPCDAQHKVIKCRCHLFIYRGIYTTYVRTEGWPPRLINNAAQPGPVPGTVCTAVITDHPNCWARLPLASPLFPCLIPVLCPTTVIDVINLEIYESVCPSVCRFWVCISYSIVVLCWAGTIGPAQLANVALIMRKRT